MLEKRVEEWDSENVYLFFFSGWVALRRGLVHVLQFPTGSAGVVPLVQGSNGLYCFLFSLNQTDRVFTAVAGQQCLSLLQVRISNFEDSCYALALPCGVVESFFYLLVGVTGSCGLGMRVIAA